MKYDSVMIIGATASGKTKLACHLADTFHGEIISADSRQVYTELTIGSGKDLNEYRVHNHQIPYHLINVSSYHSTFYLKDFVVHARKAREVILQNKHLPIICGGTGLYLDSLIKNFERIFIPENPILRKELETLETQALLNRLSAYPKLNDYRFDLSTRKRIIRALEIMSQGKVETSKTTQQPLFHPLIIGIEQDVETRKKKISNRLIQRLNNGLIEEVEALMKSEEDYEKLVYLGLEYKFIAKYLKGLLTKDEMIQKLEVAIHQFAKRQSTWFRKMEKEGFQIHWLDGSSAFHEQLRKATVIIQQQLSLS